MVEANNKLAWKIAIKLFRGNEMIAAAYGDIEDCHQHAVLGLMRAVVKFKPDKGCTFATYAWRVITNQILRYSEILLIRIPQTTLFMLHRDLPGKEHLIESGRRAASISFTGTAPDIIAREYEHDFDDTGRMQKRLVRRMLSCEEVPHKGQEARAWTGCCLKILLLEPAVR